MIRFFLLCFVIIISNAALLGQFELKNSSFEDKPQDATCPSGWIPCKLGSTPDILPGFWDVYTEASEGNTYIGLITREDGSWESIGQRLPQAIKKGECYRFSIDVARATTYENYNLPIRLRVWAGRTRCSKDQLIKEITPVENTDWQTYDFQFYAQQKVNYIILEAYYMKGMLVPYKGNVLVDNITIFKRCIKASAIREESIFEGKF